jgi:prepilin-type N-terminal cleavage/methylation domain-containing protein
MILPNFKLRFRKHRLFSRRAALGSAQGGFTLIECLAVITILAGLIAAVSTGFILTLKSYVGEYRAEALELEAQRAALELEYYAARSWKIDVIDSSVPSQEGNQVNLYQPDGSVVTFAYSPYLFNGAKQVGTLWISMPTGYYVYSYNVGFEPTATSTKPFWISSEGSLGFRWSVDTPSGPVKMGGYVLPDV